MNRTDDKNVSYQAAFYILFAVFQLAIIGIAGWTLAKVIHQGEQIARIEEHMGIPDGMSTGKTNPPAVGEITRRN